MFKRGGRGYIRKGVIYPACLNVYKISCKSCLSVESGESLDVGNSFQSTLDLSGMVLWY